MPLNLEKTFEDLTKTMSPNQKLQAARAILKGMHYVILPTDPEEKRTLKVSRMRGAA